MHMFKTYAIILFTVVVWGTSFPVIKTVLDTVPVEWLLFVRFTVAAIFVGGIAFTKKHRRPNKKETAQLVLLSFLYPIGYFLFETYGVKYTLPSNAATLIGLIPVMVLILGYLLKMEKITWMKVIGVIFSTFGVYLLVREGDNALHLKGDMLILGGAVVATFMTVVVKKMLLKFSALYITAFQFTLGALFMFPIALSRDTTWVHQLTPSLIISISFLAIICSGVATLGLNYAYSKLSMTQVSVTENLIPVVTLFAQFMLMGLVVSRTQLLAMSIVIGSVLLVQFPGKKKSEASKKKDFGLLLKD